MQLYQYQYYSTGLLSSHDPFYEQQRHLLGPKKKKIKDEKKFKGNGNSLDEVVEERHGITILLYFCFV